MPRPRKTELLSASSPVAKAKKAKKPVKKIVPPKKNKSVIVDVIEDDDLTDSSNFFSDVSLAKNSFPSLRNNKNDDSTNQVNREDTDIQKKFFSDLVSEIKNKNEEGESSSNKKSPTPVKKSLTLYRRLVWKFLVMVGLLALLVFYFSFSKLTILITPQVEAMSDTLFLRIGDATSTTEVGDPREKISGAINEFDVEVQKQYEATGEELQGTELNGKVVIVNNYIKAQQLIATTRLLSSDNKLFRIKNAVNIPAGGKVEVEIYADKASPDMAIEASHFTIPGLWVGLQDKIYAESEEAFTYGEKAEKYVKAIDIQSATKDINDLILKKAEANKPLDSQAEVLYQVLDPVDVNIGAKAGDKVSQFIVTAKAKVIMVTFSGSESAKLASAKLNILVPDDKELAEFKPESLSYNLENYDEKNKLATVKASFSGLMILKSDANIINKSSLVNLNAKQIDVYLSDYPEIGNYELQFYPSFIKKAPNLVDRIEIKIKN
ncbi:MAG: hypothetical protein WCT50_03975 [Patescibacteria group bacterium]